MKALSGGRILELLVILLFVKKNSFVLKHSDAFENDKLFKIHELRQKAEGRRQNIETLPCPRYIIFHLLIFKIIINCDWISIYLLQVEKTPTFSDGSCKAKCSDKQVQRILLYFINGGKTTLYSQ